MLVELGVALFTATAIHELGHVVAGQLVGFRLVQVAAGPVLVTRYTERFKLHWWRMRRPLLGFATMVPPPNIDEPWRMAVHIAGGPAACGFSAGGLWLLQTHIAQNAPFNGLFGAVSLASFVLGALMPAIPARKGPWMTDGAHLLDLWQGGAESELARAHRRVLGMEMHGVRARDWDEECIKQLTALTEGGPVPLFTALILYEWHLDRGDFAAAGEWIDRARETSEAEDPLSRGNVCAESAYFDAVYRNASRQARQWLDEAGSHWTLQDFVRLRAQAAVLLSEGRSLEAIECCDQGLALLTREFPSGRLPPCQREWILDIRTRAVELARKRA